MQKKYSASKEVILKMETKRRESLVPQRRESTVSQRRESMAPPQQTTRVTRKNSSPAANKTTKPASSTSGQDDVFVFKPPSSSNTLKPPAANTPGRAKPGRTQSERAMLQAGRASQGRRHLPAGAGNLFTMDDEEGEQFSSSYLQDMKKGNCNLDHSDGRLSELARRNSLYPGNICNLQILQG